jgi:hypothetical protein
VVSDVICLVRGFAPRHGGWMSGARYGLPRLSGIVLTAVID